MIGPKKRPQDFGFKAGDSHLVVNDAVDDLHEQAGSTRVLHLHGELRKARSTSDSSLVYTLNHWELNWGDLCEKGSQLRPHIVWFGEQVPAMNEAIGIVRSAEILVVIGTSLVVYPAAGLVDFAPVGCPVFVIDPAKPTISRENVFFIQEKAGVGVKLLQQKLKKYI